MSHWSKSYTIATAITAGACNLPQMAAELDALGITPNHEGSASDGTTLTVQFDATPSGAEITTIDTAVQNHDPTEDIHFTTIVDTSGSKWKYNGTSWVSA